MCAYCAGMTEQHTAAHDLLSGDGPIMFAAALETAAAAYASDLHIRPGRPPWMRIGKTLRPVAQPSAFGDADYRAACDWIGPRGVARALSAFGCRWRALVFAGGIAVRRLAAEPPPWKHLGLPDIVRSTLTTFPEGLVVLAGSTGSGKSTTIASLLSEAAYLREEHIMTIEDPIEYLLPADDAVKALITQQHIPQSQHKEALEDALRADPDLLLFGECRVPAHFELCLTLAATGHLVFTTIHAGNATAVCERIIAATGGLGHSLMASTLRAVVCQRLVRSADSSTSRHCAAEIMIVDPNTLPSIRPGGDLSHLQAKIADSPYSLERSLAHLVADGKISADDALNEAGDRRALSQLMSA